MQTSNIDPAIDMLTKRFYQRLAEALNHRFPAVPVPVAPESATLDDFYDTVHKLMREHDTPALGIEHGYRTRISDYGVVGLAIASTGNLAEAMQVQADYLAIITDTKKFRYKISRLRRWI